MQPSQQNLLSQRVQKLEQELDRLSQNRPQRKRRFFWMSSLLLVFGLGILPGLAWSQQGFSWPAGWNVFSANTPARAQDVNDNFQWILSKIGTDPAQLAVPGSIQAQSLSVSGDVSAQTVKGKALELECRQVVAGYSGTGDDSPSRANCPAGFIVTGCSCRSPWNGCGDGAERTSNTQCTAYNSNQGQRVRGVAVCCRVR